MPRRVTEVQKRLRQDILNLLIGTRPRYRNGSQVRSRSFTVRDMYEALKRKGKVGGIAQDQIRTAFQALAKSGTFPHGGRQVRLVQVKKARPAAWYLEITPWVQDQAHVHFACPESAR